MRRLLSTLTVAGLILTGTTAAQARTVKPGVSKKPVTIGITVRRHLPPCVYEDGSGGSLPCLWDATKRGNGVGRSYWIDRNGRVHYIR